MARKYYFVVLVAIIASFLTGRVTAEWSFKAAPNVVVDQGRSKSAPVVTMEQSTPQPRQLDFLSESDLPAVMSSALMKSVDGLSDTVLATAGTSRGNLPMVKYEMANTFRIISRNGKRECIPVINRSLLGDGPIVHFKPASDASASRALFSSLDYTREELTQAAKNSFKAYGAMVGKPHRYSDSKKANLVVRYVDREGEAPYTFERVEITDDQLVTRSGRLGEYLDVTGKDLVIPVGDYSSQVLGRYYYLNTQGKTRLHLATTSRAVRHEIVHLAMGLGGFSGGSFAWGHSQNPVSVMFPALFMDVNHSQSGRGTLLQASGNGAYRVREFNGAGTDHTGPAIRLLAEVVRRYL